MPASRLTFAVPLALLLAVASAAPPVAAADLAGAGTPAPRLAGATEVDPPGKYPFVVALVDRHNADAWRGHFCDGTLVADRWVLTAARCLEDRRPADVDVVLGRHDLTAAAGWRVAAVAFHVHPRHDGANLFDAALVELADAVSLTPAALPATAPLPGPATVAGWGDTQEPDRLPRRLQEAAVPLLSDSVCAGVHGDGFAPGSMVCAGDLAHGGVGACSGDRGAPLFVTGPGGATLQGIAGWGVGCALPGLPALYTRVEALAPWVQSLTGSGPFTCDGRAPTLLGTAGVDSIVGTSGNDVIVALGGRDLIDGAGGNDLICAGEGDDEVAGGDGDDVVFGDGGADLLRGGTGNDTLHGGDGDDTLSGEDGDDHLEGGAGRDRLTGSGGSDILDGGDGDDTLAAGRGRDRLAGGSGGDVLLGGAGPDVLRGGSGPDRLRGRSGDDRLHGGCHRDRLFGGLNDDRLAAGPGDDSLDGGEGDDLLLGEAGDDALRGGPGADVLTGGEGADRGGGGPGTDTCLLETAESCEG